MYGSEDEKWTGKVLCVERPVVRMLNVDYQEDESEV